MKQTKFIIDIHENCQMMERDGYEKAYLQLIIEMATSHQQDYTLMGWRMATGRIITKTVNLLQKVIMQMEKRLESGLFMMKMGI